MGAANSTSIPYTLHTKTATYEGVEQLDQSHRPVLRRFARVPYAKPPVGPLRFRRPQAISPASSGPISNGTNVTTSSAQLINTVPSYDCKEFGPKAPQPEYATNAAKVNPPQEQLPHLDEDCLYLNIWVPLTSEPPVDGWPVQFHIHGGWLQVGAANVDNESNPFDLIASSDIANRIIVAPTYRLNILGFAAGKDLTAIAQEEGDAFAGNYGLWDQRMALEWVHENISSFGGNPKQITVGGLSAGAHSALMQLYYDTYLPPDKQIISQIYLWSNSLAVQPNPATSDLLTQQFDDLCQALSIKASLSPREKVNELRRIDHKTLMRIIPKLKMHTFRSSTDGPIEDGGFVPPTYLQSLHDGSFATRLSKRGVRIMLGEVKDEGLLYKLINPPGSRDELKVQLSNYYPKDVVDALVESPLYGIPGPNDTKTIDKQGWADLFGSIAADCQVHAAIRGLSKSLLCPPEGAQAISKDSLFRYQIRWRAKGLDNVLKPEVGVCHAADTPIWWASGWRAGFDDEDKIKAIEFLKPFGRFLERQKDIGWGGDGQVDQIRVLQEDGITKSGVTDDKWPRGIEVWDGIWQGCRS